jgi:hypothetical protein
VAIDLRTGLVGSTKLVNPVVINAQAFGFNGWTISPEKNPGAGLSEVFANIRMLAIRHANHKI